MPKDVRIAFGRDVVTWSTKELDRSRAEEKALPFISGLRSEWSELRLISRGLDPEGSGKTPSQSQLVAIADEAYQLSRNSHKKREKAAFEVDPGGYEARLLGLEREQLDNIRAIEFQNLDPWVEPAVRMLERRGFNVDRTSDWFRGFVEILAEVTVSSLDVYLRGSRGEFDAQSTSKTILKARQLTDDALVGVSDVSFSELSDTFMRQWKANSNDRKTTNTEQQKRATFRLFGGFLSNRAIRSVGSPQAAEFRDALNLFDPSWARSPTSRDMSWQKLLAAYGNQPRGLSDGTMNRHMAALKELWTWARKRGHCAGDNPFEGFHKKLRPGSNVDPYVAWEFRELEQLFQPPPRRSDVTEIMIVAMFTGMRLVDRRAKGTPLSG